MNVSSKALAHLIFFKVCSEEGMWVECNICDDGDSIFFRGDRVTFNVDEEWVSKAAMHGIKNHPETVEKYE